MDIKHYPLIPLRDIVVFPHMVVTLFVGRKKSVEAIHSALTEDGRLFLVSQKKAENENPPLEDLYNVGVIAHITQVIHLPDGTVKILVEGLARGVVQSFIENEQYVEAVVRTVEPDETPLPEALSEALVKVFLDYSEYNKKISADLLSSLALERDVSRLVDLVAAQLSLNLSKQQEILEEFDITRRLEMVLAYTMIELDALKLEDKVRGRVKQQMDKNHREYYLNEQMKAIQHELHPEQEGLSEVEILKKRVAATKFPKEAKKKAEGELRKLSNMNAMSAEASIVRNYLEWMLDVPWSKSSPLKSDLAEAEGILEADHYGLTKVKERILEHLAVQQRVGKSCGQILCFVGPPGVGKTSLAESIATATGRQFQRISLGGVRDEAEIRGHRRTYIGAMPGRIIQGMKKAKVSNPLILLDEIDKIASDWRGDPASALLEVLDPMQNKRFNDHYLEVDYDLSNVLFIATANTLNLPRPLLDRMEVISISGYTEEEKIAIAKAHLVEKQKKANGLKSKELTISDGALKELVLYYTHEAGVRGLERQIAAVARKALKEIMAKPRGKKAIAVTPKVVRQYLGERRYRYGLAEPKPLIGSTTGLAWMESGGDLLTIEASLSEGRGKFFYTGKLGKVMQESIQTALSYVRSRAVQFGIDPKIFMDVDIHIHVPAGATPKDGPSAGVAMCTSLVSVLTGIPVRSDVAMTGEITLRGRVLPIGGLKEKLLAASRGGIKTVFIPEENLKDLVDVPESVLKKLKVVAVKEIEEVLKGALVRPFEPFVAKNADTAGSAEQKETFKIPKLLYQTGEEKPVVPH